MRPIPFRELVLRAFAEYRKKGSIFDIPESHFYSPKDTRTMVLFNSRAENPIGPAAGPHTQLAQNILSAFLAGGRYFELKTVQNLDSLEIEKPCIDAVDEGYNVEWSTEFSLDQAYDEYLKAWFLLHIFDSLISSEELPPSFLFNMSVGYDLDGIKTSKMDRFINRLIDSNNEQLFTRYCLEVRDLAADPALLESTPWADKLQLLRVLPDRIPGNISSSVTLSTMHGCPPDEIEAICKYLLKDKELDTLVKLNPTLIGFDVVKDILSKTGFGYIELNSEKFDNDLHYGAAVPMINSLAEHAKGINRRFGLKLSNTLAVGNNDDVLPGEEMYLSGRALYPLTIHLAADLAEQFDGNIPVSFSGGVSAWNITDILATGIRPVTLATDLLKPGGYGRLKELAEKAAEEAARRNTDRIDTEMVRRLAVSASLADFSSKGFRGVKRVHIDRPLPLFDCFIAPCIETCPIAQDVPEYIHLAGAGRYEDAFEVIYRRNPLPFITGYLCDHQCTDNCSRLEWEGPVQIRDIKRIAAEKGYARFRESGAPARLRTDPRGVNVAIIGAGPAGLSAASFLAREGFSAHVFERERDAGGVIRYVLPGFRVQQSAIDNDVSLLRDLGVIFHFGQSPAPTIDDLKSNGFRYVIIAIGAESERGIGIEGSMEVFSFLRQFRNEPNRLSLGSRVAVVGAGDTAMDAARAAARCRGVDKVTVIYRRSEQEMPASLEEYESALEDGVSFVFQRNPEGWRSKRVLECRVMELGEPDKSGRRRPVPTDSIEQIRADTVIAAAGADVDRKAIEAIGIELPAPDMVNGVFLIGDAANGASTIVKAIASARETVDAICRSEGGARSSAESSPQVDVENPDKLRAGRGRIIPASTSRLSDEQRASIEADRCIGCRTQCIKCVEVCPNRANTLFRVPGNFQDEVQIIHFDALCNECGNCATFCPWNGNPYKHKFTIFNREDDFRNSSNPGFYMNNMECLLRYESVVQRFRIDSGGYIQPDVADDSVRAVVRTITHDYPHLLTPL